GGVDGGFLSWSDRVLYEGGSLMGLPGRRLRGPFLHPNGLGDYLVISGALLWARWPALRASGTDSAPPRIPSWILRTGVVMWGAALVLTLSSAWVAVGILLLILGRSAGSFLLRGLGGIVAATTFAALVFPLRLGFGPFQVVTSGIRPVIWSDAVRAFFASPVAGVGAAPVLADAADPVDPESGLQLWDAHNAYLSVLGQFGIVGFLLVAGAVFLIVRSLVGARSRGSVVVTRGAGRDRGSVVAGPLLLDRARRGVLAALVAVGVHGLVVAGEDFRHWWALVALAGLVVGGAWAREDPARGDHAREDHGS
ncbi:MAG: O-antigen ligase family protein, partial [Gemmatimonadota bacterium]